MGNRSSVVNPRPKTPVSVVQRHNPLVKHIARYSVKWHRRWQEIECPWPIDGTFDPEVIKTLQVLISAYKAEQKTGRRGIARREKREKELGILDLFFQEGQKLSKAYRERLEMKAKADPSAVKQMKASLSEVPFSHVDPPPYTTPSPAQPQRKSVYPQLPVLSTTGTYDIVDHDDHVIETGTALTKISMEPDGGQRRRSHSVGGATVEPRKTLRFSNGRRGSTSDIPSMGGYDPLIKDILAEAERKAKQGHGSGAAVELSSDDSDDDTSGSSVTPKRGGANVALRMRVLADGLGRIQKLRDRLYRKLGDTDPDDHDTLSEIQEKLDEISLNEAELTIHMDEHTRSLKKASVERVAERASGRRYDLRDKPHRSRSTGDVGPLSGSSLTMPVLIRGQTMDYKPWAHTDVTELTHRLPPLQEGAFPFISKLEQLLVGTQLAMADIKRLLALVVGVPEMEAIFTRAGLLRYIGSAVHDADLFVQHAPRLWRALRDMYPTNMHPDNIIINALGDNENPRAYVARALQQWQDFTGNDPSRNEMEQALVRAKIQQGLPAPVRRKLAEVVGLNSMTRAAYTDNVQHQVDLHRKKEQSQREQDQDNLRKLTAAQLARQKEAKQATVVPTDIQQLPVNVAMPPPQRPSGFRPRRVAGPPGSCYACGQLGHLIKACPQVKPRRRWNQQQSQQWQQQQDFDGQGHLQQQNAQSQQWPQQQPQNGPVNPYRGPPQGGL